MLPQKQTATGQSFIDPGGDLRVSERTVNTACARKLYLNLVAQSISLADLVDFPSFGFGIFVWMRSEPVRHHDAFVM